MVFPEEIRRLVAGRADEQDHVGCSGSQVILYDDMALKIGPAPEAPDRELTILGWLRDRLPVPRVLACAVESGTRYLLLSRIPGQMLCASPLMDDVPRAAEVLAEGLQMLAEVDVTDCPVNAGLDWALRQAEENVARGLVDTAHAEPGTYGPGGFASPEALLRFLLDNRPEETPSLIHGDYCLPNVFTQDGRISGLIDLDGCGVGDRWNDVALCYRSLKRNCDGWWGAHDGWTQSLLFDALGVQPDWEKVRYYILLDELF